MSSIIFYEASVSNKLSRSASQSPPTVEIEPAVFRIGSENRVMVYEIAVPLKRPLPDAAGVGCEPGGILKIGFEWGGMTDELRKKMIEQQMSSGRRTSGAADDWAHVNARGGSSVPRQSRNPKRHSFWVDVQLAELEK